MTTGRINQVTIPYQPGKAKVNQHLLRTLQSFRHQGIHYTSKAFTPLKLWSVFKKLSWLCTTRSSTKLTRAILIPRPHNPQSRSPSPKTKIADLKEDYHKPAAYKASRLMAHPQIINCSQVWPQAKHPQKFFSEYKKQ